MGKAVLRLAHQCPRCHGSGPSTCSQGLSLRAPPSAQPHAWIANFWTRPTLVSVSFLVASLSNLPRLGPDLFLLLCFSVVPRLWYHLNRTAVMVCPVQALLYNTALPHNSLATAAGLILEPRTSPDAQVHVERPSHYGGLYLRRPTNALTDATMTEDRKPFCSLASSLPSDLMRGRCFNRRPLTRAASYRARETN
jgi:hypothetical protein